MFDAAFFKKVLLALIAAGATVAASAILLFGKSDPNVHVGDNITNTRGGDTFTDIHAGDSIGPVVLQSPAQATRTTADAGTSAPQTQSRNGERDRFSPVLRIAQGANVRSVKQGDVTVIEIDGSNTAARELLPGSHVDETVETVALSGSSAKAELQPASATGTAGTLTTTAVSWSVDEQGCGSVSPDGIYTPPPSPHGALICHVRATAEGFTDAVTRVDVPRAR